MCIETLHAVCLEELDQLVDEFTIGKIIFDVSYQEVGTSWQANIFYDDIIDTEET